MVDAPVQAGDECLVEVESLTNLGEGVARYEDYVLLIPYVLPGEKVRCRVWRTQENFGKADVVELVTRSPLRREPRCKLFGECGGCQYQHISLEGQRQWKQKHVEEVLERIGRCQDILVEPVVGGLREYGYRTKLTPHYDVDNQMMMGPIGFNTNRFRVVDVEECPIATEAINAKLPAERQEAVRRFTDAVDNYRNDTKFRKPRGATLLLRHHDTGVATKHADVVSETVRDLTFRFKAGDFWQNNAEVLPLLVDHVVDEARSGNATYLIDCYCGGGLFAICAAKDFEKVAGLEISQTSIASATSNARANNITNAHFLAGKAEDLFADVTDLFPSDATAVIVDPPRAGCSEDFLRQLLRFRPSTLVYVSCDPATQARDALFILNHSDFVISRCRPFDLFPQTRHIENCLTFQRPTGNNY